MMKRFVAPIVVILFISFSANAEDHAGGESTGRPTVVVQPQDSGSRLNDLVSACFAGRAFPPRRDTTITLPPDNFVTPPVVDPLPVIDPQPIPPPPGEGGGADASRGKAVLSANCTSCHTGFTDSDWKSKASDIERRINLPGTDPQHMPQGRGDLSAEDKAALIAFLKAQ